MQLFSSNGEGERLKLLSMIQTFNKILIKPEIL